MEPLKVFETFAALARIERLAAEQAQKIRMNYQEDNDIDGSQFFTRFGNYLEETTGKWSI